jgi:hypothetical protein
MVSHPSATLIRITRTSWQEALPNVAIEWGRPNAAQKA